MTELIHGITIVIPCLNEEETIDAAVREGLEGIRKSGLPGEVIIADNGSTDASVLIATRAGGRVVNVKERGYGSALHFGILNARYSITVFGDADMSYPFIELPKLVKPIIDGRSDFVLGSRLCGTIEKNAMPTLNRYIGTPVLSWLIRFLYNLPISDCNSGMRAFRTSIYRSLKLVCPGMEYASEMIIRVAEEKYKYSEVPIGFRKDLRNRAPHLHRWRDGWRHLRFILGNAPTIVVSTFPGAIGLLGVIIAFLLSFYEGGTHYHTAFILVVFAAPFLLLANTTILVKAARHNAQIKQSLFVLKLHEWSENASPFYVSILFFGLAFFGIVILFLKWSMSDYGHLHEMPELIRISCFSLMGTVIFSLDMGLGLLRICSSSHER